MYIDKECVVKEYLRRCKNGAWKKESTTATLKCWNLKRILDTELQHAPTPPALSLEELLKEGKGSEVASAPAVGDGAADDHEGEFV